MKPFICVALSIVLCLSRPLLSQAAEIELVEATFAFDETVPVKVTGLEPDTEVIVRLDILDSAETEWFGQSVFLASSDGEIDTSRQAPVRGMYEGIKASGPFWSLVGGNRFATEDDAQGTITVSDLSGEVIETHEFVWESPRRADRVLTEHLEINHLNATLYLPVEARATYLPILLFGGSGGGTNPERAALLASHGYAVLDIGYFGAAGTPDYFLESLPPERMSAAIDTMASDSRLNTDQLVLMGRSYGAQLALSLAIHDPRVAAVIVEAPSNMISSTPATYPYGPAQSAWAVEGVGLPFHAGTDDPAPDTLIPVERFTGDLLMLTGHDDAIWSATEMADALLERRTAAGLGEITQHLSFPDAGHNFGGGEQSYGIPNLPPRNRNGRSGGTDAGNSEASIQSWAATLAFLERLQAAPAAE